MSTTDHPAREDPRFKSAAEYSRRMGYLWFIWDRRQVWVTP